MSIINKGSQEFEPYARLINIIGDQLITDKKVAVIEIIKNCYDADAEKVSVRFFNLDNANHTHLPELQQPYIEIEDDGDGMTLEIIQKVWLRPATPHKIDKKTKKQSFTKKGRIIQGEKGVGRFAIHKLGERIEIYTKANKNDEVKLVLDFQDYNPEKADLFNQQDYKLLKDVKNQWTVQNPPIEIKKNKGTLIRISKLREGWKDKDLGDLYKSINKLIPPSDPLAEKKYNVQLENDFSIDLLLDNRLYHSENTITFEDVLERAPFKLNGIISDKGNLVFKYHSAVTNRKVTGSISLFNKGTFEKYNYDLHSYRIWFSKRDGITNAGTIHFSLYAYDLNNRDKTIITAEMTDFVKDNFIYVFRDGVRVYPFGEKEYDWLELDKLRSVVKAGAFPSYNDLIGFIYIGQEENKMLKDSTNRQGMMNIDGAYDDFRYSILAAAEILNTESKIDKEKRKIEKNKAFTESSAIFQNSFTTLKKSLEKIDDVEVLQKANKFLGDVQKYTSLIKERMETVEDLAGLGMAVEKASHDSLMLLAKMRGNIKGFIKSIKAKDYTEKELAEFLNDIDENLSFVYDEMQIIQPLFKIQRKAIQDVSIVESIDKVVKYFRRDLEGKIEVIVDVKKDFTVKTNNGLILQVLINLLDNAIYWVKKGEEKQKKISFKIDSKTNSLSIADNGPGVRTDVVPMIFNEFFSLKADGRGLGLYIVQEILLRIGAEINVVQEDSKKILKGGNFIIHFNPEP